MIRRTLLPYIVCFVTICALQGCFFSSSNKPKPKKSAKPPIITNVQSCRIIRNQYVASTSLNIGEKGTLRVTIIDKGLDIKKLFIRGFFPRESGNPAIEYGPFEVKQPPEGRTSFYLKEPILFEGEPGDWLFEVQIEDENCNLSNNYRFHVILH